MAVLRAEQDAMGLLQIKSAPEKVVVLQQSCLCSIQGKCLPGKEFWAAHALGGNAKEE